jgi:hypothetical protein
MSVTLNIELGDPVAMKCDEPSSSWSRKLLMHEVGVGTDGSIELIMIELGKFHG